VRTIFSDDQLLHHGRGELNEGRIDPAFEKPARVGIILRRIHEVGLGSVLEPDPFERGPIERVHAPDYVDFLEGAWDDWVAEHGDAVDGLPLIWPVRTLRQKCPRQIDGRVSWYAMDAGTPITKGMWSSVTASASVALTGVRLIDGGERAVFSLCRPPGHHAATDLLGGYCYLNNAAIASQSLIDHGARRVVVLDIDYHHGNGTQAIFYERPDVLFLSIHADPADEFPHFLGYADEIGTGAGEGATANWPLPLGTGRAAWMEALEQACGRIERFGADALVISLGVDTFRGDPISQFTLDSEDFAPIGARIARLGLPTLFVMEGGYAVEAIGINALGVLTGFEGA